MSDADIKANIGVSTDVEQATRRTQSGIVSMSKQIEDVTKKFSTAGKDIFLGFFAPMAILQTAISFISDRIAQAKQDAKDGLELLAKGETSFASNEEARTAAFFKRRAEIEQEKKLVEKGRQEITEKLLTSAEGRGFVLPREGANLLQGGASLKTISELKSVQDAALEFFKNTPEGKRIIAETPLAGKQPDFKGPEGFSNVVGVGANPVLEAISAQLEESQKQTALLEQINAKTPDKGEDFTKPSK
jgi:hypothetical protein